MFIQTEATPNPATLKFIPGKPVLPGSTREYKKAADALESPLAEKLFSVAGVSGVFLGHDFITVSKGTGEWQHLKPAILGLIMDHYVSGAPMLAGEAPVEQHGEEFFEADQAETVRSALATLPDEQREVVLLRHVIGLTPGEIADRMGRTEGSIHGLHHRGRRALQRELERLDSAPFTRATRQLVAA